MCPYIDSAPLVVCACALRTHHRVHDATFPPHHQHQHHTHTHLAPRTSPTHTTHRPPPHPPLAVPRPSYQTRVPRALHRPGLRNLKAGRALADWFVEQELKSAATPVPITTVQQLVGYEGLEATHQTLLTGLVAAAYDSCAAVAAAAAVSTHASAASAAEGGGGGGSVGVGLMEDGGGAVERAAACDGAAPPSDAGGEGDSGGSEGGSEGGVGGSGVPQLWAAIRNVAPPLLSHVSAQTLGASTKVGVQINMEAMMVLKSEAGPGGAPLPRHALLQMLPLMMQGHCLFLIARVRPANDDNCYANLPALSLLFLSAHPE